jgi:hypothetical protein
MATLSMQREGVHPRHDEKSAEVIDRQRIVRRPLRKRVRNPLKRKDLNAKYAKTEMTHGEKVGAVYRQTRGRIAQNSALVKLFVSYHSNRAVRR